MQYIPQGQSLRVFRIPWRPVRSCMVESHLRYWTYGGCWKWDFWDFFHTENDVDLVLINSFLLWNLIGDWVYNYYIYMCVGGMVLWCARVFNCVFSFFFYFYTLHVVLSISDCSYTVYIYICLVGLMRLSSPGQWQWSWHYEFFSLLWNLTGDWL